MIARNSTCIKKLGIRVQMGFARLIINQYKFYIDFKGLMYFEDGSDKHYGNIIRDKKFIQQFYRHLKVNTDDLSKEYHYVSEFWAQKNYLSYAIAPIVFTNIQENMLEFSVGMKTPFNPHELCLSKEGLLWHPYQTLNILLKGVFSNQLLSQLVPNLVINQNSTSLNYMGKQYIVRQEQG